MRILITFALLSLLCTSVRAQQNGGKYTMPLSVTSIAFIKDAAAPFAADSLTLRTSLDTLPYGFSFVKDTVILDVNIFPPIDELTVELLENGKSFGRFSFWVDAPSANVHLSIKDQRTEVDSVTLSGVDTWYREQLFDLSKAKGLVSLSQKLTELTYLTSGDLMGATFGNALVDLPNVSTGTLYELREGVLPNLPFLMKRHSRYQELADRVKLIGRRPGNFSRLRFFNDSGKRVRIKLPERLDYYILDLYNSDDPRAQRAHQQIRDIPALDSLLTKVVPMLSISNDPSPALWRLYVNDNDYDWPHFVEDPKQAESLSFGIPFVRRPVYLLMNRKHRVEGVYFNLQSLVNTVRWRTK